MKSWGIFVGIFGAEIKNIVIAQNRFKFNDELFDLDYTSIPLSFPVSIVVITRGFIPADVARQLVLSFVEGRKRRFGNRIAQRRVSNHHGLD